MVGQEDLYMSEMNESMHEQSPLLASTSAINMMENSCRQKEGDLSTFLSSHSRKLEIDAEG